MSNEFSATDDMMFGKVGICDGEVFIQDCATGEQFYPTDEQMEAIDLLWPEYLRKPLIAESYPPPAGAVH